MILDSRDIARDGTLEADICIIGAGAAGISIALELAGGPYSVVVLEGGGLEYDQRSQELYDGPESGTLIEQGQPLPGLHPSPLLRRHHQPLARLVPAARSRGLRGPGLGGEQRLADLRRRRGSPSIHGRASWLEISPFDYDQSKAGIYERLLAGDDHFDTNFFHMSPPTRFGQRYRPQLEAAANLRVVTDANVRSIEVDAEARHVTHLDVVRADGSPLPVRCRHYVLATGGIENARLLLNSDSVQAAGLGNDRDLVGRYFMEHPLQRVGSVVIPHRHGSVPKTYSRSFVKDRDNWIQGVIRARPAVQRRLELLNAVMVVTPQQALEHVRPGVRHRRPREGRSRAGFSRASRITGRPIPWLDLRPRGAEPQPRQPGPTQRRAGLARHAAHEAPVAPHGPRMAHTEHHREALPRAARGAARRPRLALVRQARSGRTPTGAITTWARPG